MNWEDLHAHIEQAVRDRGKLVLLCDADGVPVCELPVVDKSAKETLVAAASGELTIPVRGRMGQMHEAVRHLLVDNVGEIRPDGTLAPVTDETWIIVVCTEGERSAFIASHPRAPLHPINPPDVLHIPVAYLSSLLEFWPAPSVPQVWTPTYVANDGKEYPAFEEWTEDAGGAYETPRTYAPVQFATVADGHTMDGPAEYVIRTLIQDSLDAVNNLKEWADDPHMVVDFADPRPSERVVFRVEDRSVMDTIAQTATQAGVHLSVVLWWPGDEPVTVRTRDREGTTTATWDRPMAVCRVVQGVKEVTGQ